MRRGGPGQATSYVLTWFKHVMIRTNTSLASKDHTRKPVAGRCLISELDAANLLSGVMWKQAETVMEQTKERL